MTRKHFIAIAALLKSNGIVKPAAGFDEGYAAATDNIAEELATMFANENPRFDRARFLEACRVD